MKTKGGTLGGGYLNFERLGEEGLGVRVAVEYCVRVGYVCARRVINCRTAVRGQVSTEQSVGFGGFDFLVAGEVCARLLE